MPTPKRLRIKSAKTDALYSEIKSILNEARRSAYRAVNFAMVAAYWEIGKRIVEPEQKGKAKADYGVGLLKELPVKPSNDFGKGYSLSSLKDFRQFYLSFSGGKGHEGTGQPLPEQKSHALHSELGWTHYRLLMRVENEKARDYYLRETIAQDWSTRALERQINSFYYERLLSSKKKKDVQDEASANTGALAANPLDFIKDPFVLEFLDLSADNRFLEKELAEAFWNWARAMPLWPGKNTSVPATTSALTSCSTITSSNALCSLT